MKICFLKIVNYKYTFIVAELLKKPCIIRCCGIFKKKKKKKKNFFSSLSLSLETNAHFPGPFEKDFFEKSSESRKETFSSTWEQFRVYWPQQYLYSLLFLVFFHLCQQHGIGDRKSAFYLFHHFFMLSEFFPCFSVSSRVFKVLQRVQFFNALSNFQKKIFEIFFN